MIGFIQVKPEGSLPGNLGQHLDVHHHERVSLAFDGSGTKLIYIDDRVQHLRNLTDIGRSHNLRLPSREAWRNETTTLETAPGPITVDRLFYGIPN